MSVPKQRHTKTRRDRKRKRFVVGSKKTQACQKCGKQMVPHRACSFCGYYRGKEAVNTIKNKKVKKS